MVAITATNSTTPSLQAILSRTRLAQAQREADQAEAHAQDLRAQAQEAERESQESHARVQFLGARLRSSDPTYEPQLRGKQSEPTAQSDNVLAEVDQYARKVITENGNNLKDILNAIPVSPQILAKGQLVNESA